MRHTFFRITTVLFLATSLIAAPFVVAEDLSSANFIVRDAVSNDFGGSASSTNFSTVQSGGELTDEEASSTSFTLNSGTLLFETFTPLSQNWRWYDDSENETPSSALAAENTAPINIENQNVIKLRITVAETGGISAEGVKFRLQFATSSTFDDGGTNVAENLNCTGGSQWCYADGVDVDGGGIASSTLSDADLCLASVGDGCGTHNESGTTTSSFTHQANAATEYEFTIRQSGGLTNTVYFFRLYHTIGSSTVALNVGESRPSLVTGGADLSFSIDGVNSSTATEGITTDITTTAVAIPFGTLALDAEIEAAQRLTVTTNASQGYKVFAYQRQGFLGDTGSQILPITGTNATPSPWGTGCSASAAGCYGYHSGDDVLDTTPLSDRFAADNTYAQFDGAPYEVAFSAGPVTDEETDIVYKVQARDLQAADSYSTNVVYIVVPVF
jgi:hypothetical protein